MINQQRVCVRLSGLYELKSETGLTPVLIHFIVMKPGLLSLRIVTITTVM